MRFFKKIFSRIFWWLAKLILPKKYFNPMFISDFIHSKFLNKITLSEKIWCFREGFLPSEFCSYNLKNNSYTNYLPALKNYSKAGLNGRFNDILGNKILFGEFIKAIINETDLLGSVSSIAFIENGNLFSLNPEVISGEYISLIPYLQKTGLIVKPIFGHQGRGIFFISKKGDDYYIDNQKKDWMALTDFFKSLNNHLIQERFIQNGISHNIYPASLNTIRIGTMTDPLSSKPFVSYAMHRFGSLLSGERDNISQGGLGAYIDIDTGKLSKAMLLADSGEIEIYEKHPVSGHPISGQQIPQWNDLVSAFLEMTARIPYLKYVGWDVILSDNRFFILEGNVCPGIEGIQMHKPLLLDEKVRKFLEYHEFL